MGPGLEKYIDFCVCKESNFAVWFSYVNIVVCVNEYLHIQCVYRTKVHFVSLLMAFETNGSLHSWSVATCLPHCELRVLFSLDTEIASNQLMLKQLCKHIHQFL